MTSPWPTALLTALRRGQLLVAEIPASTPGRRAWIAVYPLTTAAGAGFNLFHREFDRAHLDNDWCIGPDDLGVAEPSRLSSGLQFVIACPTSCRTDGW